MQINFSFAQKKNKKVLEKLASEYLDGDEYEKALPFLFQLDTLEPNNGMYRYMTGVALLKQGNNIKRAVSELKLATELPKPNSDAYYFLGQAYHLNNQLDEAVFAYRTFLKNPLSNNFDEDIIKNAIDQCEHAKVLIAAPLDYKVENGGSTINSMYDDFSSVLNAAGNEMYIATRRPSNFVVRDKSFEKIFYYKKIKGKWQFVNDFGNPFTVQGHVVLTYLSANSKHALISRSDEKNSGDVYAMDFGKDLNFIHPYKFTKSLLSKRLETNATMTADSSMIYFVSDKSGGFGGKDIYRIRRIDRTLWSQPELLGNSINTRFDENCPMISADGKTLYFSSQGHYSMGGYDVFKVQMENGNWSQPANLGYPINSTADDLYFNYVQKTDEGWFTSNRQEGNGGWDIYHVDYRSNILEVPHTVMLKGNVVDAQTNKSVASSIFIELVNDTATILLTGKTDAAIGEFNMLLQPAKKYKVKVTAPNYLPYEETITNVDDKKTYQEFVRKIKLSMPGDVVKKEIKTASKPSAVVASNQDALQQTGSFHAPAKGDLVFKVYLASLNSAKALAKNPKVEIRKDTGKAECYIGNFEHYEDALGYAAKMKFKGFKHAKVIAEYQGKIVPMELRTE